MMGSDLGQYGSQDQSAQAPAASSNGDSTRAATDTIRQLIAQVGQLAQQLPEAQQELQMAATALTRASLKIAASLPSPATGQPLIGA